MVSIAATSLRDGLESKIRELEEAARATNEETAARRPGEGEWCVKEVLSHLCGEEGEGFIPSFRRFVEEDTPLIGLRTGIPYYTPKRQALTRDELLSNVRDDYAELAGFLGGLSDEQLARTARVPFLKETPLGEYPTLVQFAGAIVSFHLTDHINQIRAASQSAGA